VPDEQVLKIAGRTKDEDGESGRGAGSGTQGRSANPARRWHRATQGGGEAREDGDEIRNLPQMKVGDRVVVTYARALALQLKKVGAGIRERVGGEGGAGAAPGERPATVVGRGIAVVAEVVAVNYIKQTVTLRGSNQTVRLVVPDAVQLKTITTGDQVHAIYAEAFAVALRAAPRTSGGE